MNNWIKYHAINLAAPLNNRGLSRAELLQANLSLWQPFNEDSKFTPEDVKVEFDRLFETGQLVEKDNVVVLGKVLFEEGVEVSVKATKAAKEIYKNLTGRRGIGNELETVDKDVKDEIINTIASIIDKHR